MNFRPLKARAFGLAWALILIAQPAAADFLSPGELSKAHAKLEGLSNCTQCHAGGQQLSSGKCISCHTELKAQLANGSGFHGHIPASERSCQSCHHEHQGRDFRLIDWLPSKKAFPHQKVGLPLLGKHAQVDCNQCHEPRLIQNKQVLELLSQQPGRQTFLGLPTRCSACHFDEHRGQLGDKCQTCHREQGWKPAPGFDHRKTDFALTGRHQKVACTGCHQSQEDQASSAKSFPPPVSQTFVSFEKIPHQSCQDCHRDPHEGKFGANCQTCHNTSGWKKVQDTERGKDLHDKTRFPLEGMHRGVACARCHGPFPGQRAKFRGLSFQTCSACHADAHLGQLVKPLGRAGSQCEACHTTDGFLPAKFEPQDHQKTPYPLEGAHRAAACVGCHTQEPSLANRIPRSVRAELKRQKRTERFSFALFNLRMNYAQCQSCHRDPHGDQFASKVAAQGCTGCHQLTSFADLRFDHARDSRFPLTGKHASATCTQCHLASGGKQMVRYRPLETACQACHADVHAKQFAHPCVGTDCASCHGTEDFKKTTFVHAPPFTSFILEGKHASIQCTACHPDVRLASNVVVRRYRALPKTCQGCHVDVHRGAFRGFAPEAAR